MAINATTPNISYIKDGSGSFHAIDAVYLGGKTLDEILGAGFQVSIFTTLPTASANYKSTMGLVADSSDTETGSYIEYVCVNTSGSNWVWEPIGTTKMAFTGGTAANAKTGVTVKYDKANTATGSAGAATISGSNFTFIGTTSTITVPAHSHSISTTSKYLTTSSVPLTFSADSAIKTLKTASIVPVSGSTTVITGYTAPTKVGLATETIIYNTDAIKSYPGSFAKLTTATAYGIGTTTVYGTGTTYAAGPGSDVKNIFNGATVVDGVLSFNVTTVRSAGADVTVSNGTSRTVANASPFTYATGATSATSITTNVGAQIQIGLGTAVAATKATQTVATGSTTTGTVFMTDLGTASVTTVALPGTAKTVVTGVNDTINAYTGIASYANPYTGISTTGTIANVFISAVNANTGNNTAQNISYQPAGSIGGSQSIAAHTHSISATSTNATVTDNGHTHSVTLS